MSRIDDLSRVIGNLEGTLNAVVIAIGNTQRTTADGLTSLREAIAAQHGGFTDLKIAINALELQFAERKEQGDVFRDETTEKIAMLEEEIDKLKIFKVTTNTATYVVRTILIALAGVFGYLLTKLEQFFTLPHGRP